MTDGENERLQRGLAKIKEVGGVGEPIIAMMGDLGRYLVEFGFGDVYSRPGLSLRDRELASIAALMAMGGREAQLKTHFGAALDVGITPEEIEEVILTTVLYAGFPSGINAVMVLKGVLAERGARSG